MIRQNIKTKIYGLIEELTNHHLRPECFSAVEDDTNLRDIGFDELDELELIMMLEDDFGIRINYNPTMVSWRTPLDIYNIVEEKLNEMS